jgi:hypothetical protein
VREYDANGGNGSRAWLASHPSSKSPVAAAQSAYQALKNPQVKARLEALSAARWKRLEMKGDEALARVAMDARPDIRQAYSDDGKLLPVRFWPESLVNSVKAVRQTADGGVVITLNDSLAARRIILEQTGKLKNPLEKGVLTLARVLRGDFTAEEDEGA